MSSATLVVVWQAVLSSALIVRLRWILWSLILTPFLRLCRTTSPRCLLVVCGVCCRRHCEVVGGDGGGWRYRGRDRGRRGGRGRGGGSDGGSGSGRDGGDLVGQGSVCGFSPASVIVAVLAVSSGLLGIVQVSLLMQCAL